MTKPDTYGKRFADAVADVIEAEMWDQRIPDVAPMARKIGMSHPALGRRLRKEQPFHVDEIAAIADILGLTPMTIMTRALERIDNLTELPLKAPKRKRKGGE